MVIAFCSLEESNVFYSLEQVFRCGFDCHFQQALHCDPQLYAFYFKAQLHLNHNNQVCVSQLLQPFTFLLGEKSGQSEHTISHST